MDQHFVSFFLFFCSFCYLVIILTKFSRPDTIGDQKQGEQQKQNETNEHKRRQMNGLNFTNGKPLTTVVAFSRPQDGTSSSIKYTLQDYDNLSLGKIIKNQSPNNNDSNNKHLKEELTLSEEKQQQQQQQSKMSQFMKAKEEAMKQMNDDKDGMKKLREQLWFVDYQRNGKFAEFESLWYSDDDDDNGDHDHDYKRIKLGNHEINNNNKKSSSSKYKLSSIDLERMEIENKMSMETIGDDKVLYP